MASWAAFANDAPELASQAADRFRHHKHCLLATLRPDGSPRISGVEVWWWQDDLWLGLMPASSKGSDLERDPRFELHSAPTDLDLHQPDARLWGRVERIHDQATIAGFAASLPYPDTAPGEMDLYRIDLDGAALVRVIGEELAMDWWRPGMHPTRVTRT